MKSDIRKKIQIYNELELPLLIKSGFIPATANCNNVTTNRNTNNPLNIPNTENSFKILIFTE